MTGPNPAYEVLNSDARKFLPVAIVSLTARKNYIRELQMVDCDSSRAGVQFTRGINTRTPRPHKRNNRYNQDYSLKNEPHFFRVLSTSPTAIS
jgi:hypothetical protein